MLVENAKIEIVDPSNMDCKYAVLTSDGKQLSVYPIFGKTTFTAYKSCEYKYMSYDNKVHAFGKNMICSASSIEKLSDYLGKTI